MRFAYRLVLLVVLLQATATVTLWTLSPTEPASQAVFAILLGIDLFGFAMVSYLYRTDKSRAGFNRPSVLVGCIMFAILLLAVLFVA